MFHFDMQSLQQDARRLTDLLPLQTALEQDLDAETIVSEDILQTIAVMLPIREEEFLA